MPKWEYFCDTAYYDLWAVRPLDNKSFEGAVHVRTKEEAKSICNKLNRIAQLEEALTAIANGDEAKIWEAFSYLTYDVAVEKYAKHVLENNQISEVRDDKPNTQQ